MQKKPLQGGWTALQNTETDLWRHHLTVHEEDPLKKAEQKHSLMISSFSLQWTLVWIFQKMSGKFKSVLLSAVTEIQCIYQRYFKTSGLKCWFNIFKEKGLKILSDKQDLFCRVWFCNLTVMLKALYDILITFIGNTFAGESFNNN